MWAMLALPERAFGWHQKSASGLAIRSRKRAALLVLVGDPVIFLLSY